MSAITLLELAVLCSQGALDAKVTIDDLFHQLESNPAFEIAPLSVAVATEVAAIGSALRDPADRAIVATARIERLRLITSDQRIIESNLVSVIT